MKTLYTTAVTAFAILMLASGGLLVTHAATPQDWQQPPSNNDHGSQFTGQTLALQFGGAVMDSGTQHYNILQTGNVGMMTLAGFNIDPTQANHLSYTLDATVQGTSVTGHASFLLTASLVGGGNVIVSGNAQLNGMVPAVCVPGYINGEIPGQTSCASTDTSAVPAFFMGMATLQIITPSSNSNDNPSNNGNNGHHGDNGYGQQDSSSPQQSVQVPMLFESAYLNPFGAPIVFGTADNFGTLMVITTYTHASVDWRNVAIGGQVGGQLGSSTTFAGTFAQVSNEYEDLVTGRAYDYGTMSFSNVINMSDTSMSPINSLDVAGTYNGFSIIPKSSTYACVTTSGAPTTCSNSDCSAMLGFQPPVTGVCTNTGFESQGNFNLQGQSSTVMGSYTTAWTVPAFGFAGMTTSATVYIQPAQQGHQGQQNH